MEHEWANVFNFPDNVTQIFKVLMVVLLAATAFKIVLTAIYNVYFHPLRHFPGPWLAKATPLPYVKRMLNGRMVEWMTSLHLEYGDAVRIQPDEITFTCSAAWNAIYGSRPQLPKPHYGPGSQAAANGVHPIVTISGSAEHARHRRILNHAFSERALKEQEHILHRYVDLFIEKLQQEAKAGCTVNIMDWFNFVILDIISDLSFGRSFTSLEKGNYHPWIQTIYKGMKLLHTATAFTLFPPLGTILSTITPGAVKRLLQKPARDHFKFTQQQIDHRLKSGATRPDFMQFIIDNNDKQGLSRAEIDATVNLLIFAGGETSGVSMSGATWFLLKNPKAMERVKREVRQTFKRSQDIAVADLSKLTYLHAVLREAMRLHPPAVISLPRYTDRPIEVDGWHVPKGARIGVPHRTANYLPWNFVDAESFVPERWLPEADSKYDNDRKGAFQPFLVGPRNCIGQNLAWSEMKLVMTKMLWHFDLELTEDNPKDWSDQRVFLIYERLPLNVRLHPTDFP